ncbi:MAG: 7TM diverse intracellular signaling domain-containing protein [Segetibacter sp.]
MFSFFITGFNLAISIFGFINYYNRQRDKAYLWYGVSNLLAVCIFVLIDNGTIILDTPLWNNLNQLDYFLFFNAATVLAYFQFQIQILQLQVNKPKLAKLINVYAVIIIAGVLFTLIADQLIIFPAF